MVVPESIQGSEIARCRHGEGGKFTENQSATLVGGMELAHGGLLDQCAASMSMVPEK